MLQFKPVLASPVDLYTPVSVNALVMGTFKVELDPMRVSGSLSSGKFLANWGCVLDGQLSRVVVT